MSDDIERERLKLEHERLRIECDRPGFEASTNLARDAIRNAILINGAAAVALLTFLGHDQAYSVADTAELARALLCFGSGVFAAAFCSLLAYLFQVADRELSQWPVLGNVLRPLAIVSGIGSIAFFVGGLWIASDAFTRASGVGFWQ